MRKYKVNNNVNQVLVRMLPCLELILFCIKWRVFFFNDDRLCPSSKAVIKVPAAHGVIGTFCSVQFLGTRIQFDCKVSPCNTAEFFYYNVQPIQSLKANRKRGKQAKRSFVDPYCRSVRSLKSA